MIKTYPSISALRNDYLRLVKNGNKPLRLHQHKPGAHWYNNETVGDTLRLAEIGDTSLVPLAEQELEKLSANVETPRMTWTRNVAGAFCSVPDVLAGLPTPMRRLRHVPNETAPITIAFDMGTSGSISAEIVRKRGISILALVLALTRIRPVTLYHLDAGNGRDTDGDTVMLTQINTSPLDLATACYVMTSVGFTRRICYELEEVLNGHTGGWPSTYGYHRGDSGANPYYDTLVLRLGLDPKNTLIINAVRANDPLVTDPITWVQKQIDRFTSQEEGTM